MGFGLLGGGNDNPVSRSAPPIQINITRSATKFEEVPVSNYGLLCPADGTYDGTNVFYRSERDRGGAITRLEYFRAKGGVCLLPASQSWWVNCQTNIAAGTSRMVLYDLPTLEAAMAMISVLQNASNSTARQMAQATTATVTAADTSIVVANAARTFVAISHTGTTDGTTATASKLYLSFGVTAGVANGICLQAGQTISFDTTTGITLQEIRGISTSGNICVGVQQGF